MAQIIPEQPKGKYVLLFLSHIPQLGYTVHVIWQFASYHVMVRFRKNTIDRIVASDI